MQALTNNSSTKHAASTMETTDIAAAEVKCRLLSLPAELRNRIYEMVVVHQQPITMSHRRRHRLTRTPPAITRTCQQIKNESLPIFYEWNTFRLYDACMSRRVRPDAPLCFGFTALRLEKMKHIQIQMCQTDDNFYDMTLGPSLSDYELTAVIQKDGPATFDDAGKRRCAFVNATQLSVAKETLDSLVQEGSVAFGEGELVRLLAAVAQSRLKRSRAS